METHETIYLICFFVGLGFAIISGLLSGVFGGGHDGIGHADLSGHADVGGHDVAGGDVHFPLLSPVTISMFLASFGGTGMILEKLGWSVLAQIPVATFSGVAVAGAVFYLFYKVFSITGASSAARESDIVGTEAQVMTKIPVDGIGEISYTIGVSRFTAPARSVDGKEIGAPSLVKIAKVVGNSFYVERLT